MTETPSSILTRRVALKMGLACLSLAACKPSKNQSQKHVAVIGGGIVGASIAYHLSLEGVKVTLIEQHEIATRASRGTFAWINATWAKQPREYHRFNQAGLGGWQRLQSELAIPVRWGGSLEWFSSAERQTKLIKQIQEQADWGEPARMIGREALMELEPEVDFGALDQAAYSPNDGAVDPVLATHKLIEAAKLKDTVVKTNCLVRGVEAVADGRSRLVTSCGDLVVDQYVLATGADPDSPQALAGINIPQRTTPGVIVITKPFQRVLNRIIVAPGVHIHQRDDGRIVLGEQDGAPDTEAHLQRLKGRPNLFPNETYSEQHALRILDIAREYIPAIENAKIEDVYIGWRPLPIDGHPVIGRSPNKANAYFALMHSGVSLAPIVGEVVAREILTGEAAVELNNYRPNRNFEELVRY